MDFHKAKFRKPSRYSKYINSESRDNASKNSRRRIRDRGPKRQMHDATCGKCGNPCKIPFKPRQRKPVLCSDCFNKKPEEDRRSKQGRFSSRGRKEKTRSNSFVKKDYKGGSETFYTNLREKLFEILGGKKCANCGFSDERALGFSDVDNKQVFDGIKRGGSASSWEKYILEPDFARKKLQVLCLNCNQTK